MKSWYNSLTVLYVFRDKKKVIKITIPSTIKHIDFKIPYILIFWLILAMFSLSDWITTFGFVVFVKTETSVVSVLRDTFFSTSGRVAVNYLMEKDSNSYKRESDYYFTAYAGDIRLSSPTCYRADLGENRYRDEWDHGSRHVLHPVPLWACRKISHYALSGYCLSC